MNFSFSLLPHVRYKHWKNTIYICLILIIIGFIVPFLFFKKLAPMTIDDKSLETTKNLKKQISVAQNKIAQIDKNNLSNLMFKDKALIDSELSKLIWLNFIENVAYMEKINLKFVQQVTQIKLKSKEKPLVQNKEINHNNRLQNSILNPADNFHSAISYIQFGITGNFDQLVNFFNHITSIEQTNNILNANIKAGRELLEASGIMAFSSKSKPIFVRESKSKAITKTKHIHPFSKINKQGKPSQLGHMQFGNKETFLFESN